MTRDKTILIKNIYYMLSYAFTALRRGGYESVAAEEFDNLHNLFAAILVKGVGRQLKQGLYRQYVSRRESLASLRGKVDLSGTLRNRFSRKRELVCDYDELSENNLLNRVLKTTLLVLLKQADVEPKYKKDLKTELAFFSGVDMADPARIPWSAIRFERNNSSYRMLISLCQLVLEGLLMTTEEGEYRLASFLDEQAMCRLYEKFLLEFYMAECPRLKAAASRIPWALDDGVGTYLPEMQTDITLTRGSRVLIIDAKYYSRTMQEKFRDVRTIHSGNLYQIFTYVKNKAAAFPGPPGSVSGMLLYARTDEQVQPDGTYLMSGSRIAVRTLDLNREFREIARALKGIAEEFLTGEDGGR